MQSEHKIYTLNHTYNSVGEDVSWSQDNSILKLIGPKLFLLKSISHSFQWHYSTCLLKNRSLSQEGKTSLSDTLAFRGY